MQRRCGWLRGSGQWPVASEIGAVLRRRVSFSGNFFGEGPDFSRAVGLHIRLGFSRWGPSTVGESSTIAYGAAELTVGASPAFSSSSISFQGHSSGAMR